MSKNPQLESGTLIPAYGRDYKTAGEVAKAYKKGKDFIYLNLHSTYDGKYCSCRDFPGQKMKLRYNKKRDVTFVTVGDDDA